MSKLVSLIVTLVCILCGVSIAALVQIVVARGPNKVVSIVWNVPVAGALVPPRTHVLDLAPHGFGTEHTEEW